jgi:predicted ATPase
MIYLRAIRMKWFPESEQNYPFNLPLIRNLDEIEFTSPVTFFVGENGSGKSTLLEAIAAGMETITIGSSRIEDDPTLEPARKLGSSLRFVKNQNPRRGFYFRAEDAFGFTRRVIHDQQDLREAEQELAESVKGDGKEMAVAVVRNQRLMLNRRYGDNPDAFSHGESFLNVLKQRMSPDGFYLLDEPETPLSPMRQIALLALLKQCVDDECQCLIATHSPILMAFPDAHILRFEDGQIQTVDYDDIEHVSITRQFLNNPEAFLRRLYEEDSSQGS